VDDRLHVGSEFRPANLVTLRAGLQKDRHTDEGLTYAFGAGLDFKLLRQTLRLDYAYTVPPSLPDMSTFSMSILFDLFSRLVKIEKVNISPIYASLYKRQSQDSIGTAVIRYKGKEQLNYKISASIPQYSRPNPKEFFIEPRSAPRASRDHGKIGKSVFETVETVPLYAFLTDSILMVEGNTPMTAKVTVSYLVNRKIRTAEAGQAFKLFPRNCLNWAAGVEQVAAFIDNEDNDIEAAANDFLARVPAEILINSNINRAQKLFEGLGLVGITYKEDPYEAYAQVYAGLDKVLYPYQLLKEKRTGDCDDLTVLYAALLENCNIPVALISAPGHIFLMFDTDIPERQQEMLRLPSSMYHIFDGTVWIPIEITEVGKSFDIAWEKGVTNFQAYAAAGDTEIVKVRTAWKKYEAVKYPQNLKRTTPQIRYAATGNFVRQIRQRQEEYMNGLKQQLAQDPVEARQKLSRAHALQGEYAEAEKYLREVIALEAKNFVAYNNLGNVYFLQGRLDSAAANYAKALPLAKTADDSLGIRLNFGALYHAGKDDTLAAEMIADALRDDNDLPRVERLLGLKFDEIDMGKAGAEQSLGVSAFSMI
jgi:tetratricopeptide (TPR) repeat protein